jgi:hypothetical protein
MNVRLFGLFLLLEDKTSTDASFFSLKNSKLVVSSNGKIGFFFVKRLMYGFFKELRSTVIS